MTTAAPTAPRTARRPLVAGFVVWTLFVWATRIRNIAEDGDLTTGGRIWRTAIAVGLTALAAGVAVAWVRRSAWLPAAVRVLAVATVVVWTVRGIGILIADHDVGFKVVHTVLAVVSIALAVACWPRPSTVSGSADPRPG